MRELTICPHADGLGADVKVGGGPFIDDEPVFATFALRADAEAYVTIALRGEVWPPLPPSEGLA